MGYPPRFYVGGSLENKESIANRDFKLRDYVNVFSGLGLAFLFFDALIATWNWNPIYDILFARIRGPLFYENHASVVIFACTIAMIKIFQKGNGFDSVSHWTLAILATGSFHELTIAIEDFTIGGFRLVSITTSLNYMVWLLVFLTLGLVFLRKTERRRLILLGCFFAIIFVFSIVQLADKSFPQIMLAQTIVGFNPGPNFMDPIENFAEIWTWDIPLVFWLIPI